MASTSSGLGCPRRECPWTVGPSVAVSARPSRRQTRSPTSAAQGLPGAGERLAEQREPEARAELEPRALAGAAGRSESRLAAAPHAHGQRPVSAPSGGGDGLVERDRPPAHETVTSPFVKQLSTSGSPSVTTTRSSMRTPATPGT